MSRPSWARCRWRSIQIWHLSSPGMLLYSPSTTLLRRVCASVYSKKEVTLKRTASIFDTVFNWIVSMAAYSDWHSPRNTPLPSLKRTASSEWLWICMTESLASRLTEGALGWHRRTRGYREESTTRQSCCSELRIRSHSYIRERYTRLRWVMSCCLKGLVYIHMRIQSFLSFLSRYQSTLGSSGKHRACKRS